MVFTGGLSGDRLGYMPLKRGYGFVDVPGHRGDEELLLRTLAHELGHGAFGLEHLESRYGHLGYTGGGTDNLMDRGTGTHLGVWQWHNCHDPEVKLPGSKSDREAESVAVGSEIAVGYDRNFVYYSSDDPSERLLCLTPAGERYLLPAGATGIFYHAASAEGPEFGEGALIGYFLPQAGESGSEVASYGHIGGRLLRAWYSAGAGGGRSFGGYAEKFGDLGSARRGEFYVPYGEADAAGMAVTVPRVEGCEVVVHRGPAETAYHSDDVLSAVLEPGAAFGLVTANARATGARLAYFGRDCLDEVAYCREAFRGHPYLSGGGDPLSRAVRDDPCLLKGVYHVEWRDYPESQWMSDLKDVFAGLLAVGFTPAIVAVGAPILIEVGAGAATSAASAKASSAAVAMALDASIQTGIHYYFPEGGEEITWPEAAGRISATQVGFTGVQSLLEVKDKRAEFMIQAVSDCVFSGFVDERGALREAFSGTDCATAVATQGVVFAITRGSGAAWRRLKGLPRAELARGLLRILPPGEIGGPQVATMPGLGLPTGARLWLYRQVRGATLDGDDVRALFDVGAGDGLADDVADAMAGALSEPSADKALRDALTVDDWWAQLRGALTAEERVALLGELVGEEGLDLAKRLSKGAYLRKFLDRSSWRRQIVNKHGDNIRQFKTEGISVFDVPERVVIDMKSASSAPPEFLEGAIKDAVESGATVPQKLSMPAGSKLYKIVPRGDDVSPFSPYWVTETEWTRVSASSEVEQLLGLPIGSHSVEYDLYEITASRSIDVFESTVAPTFQNGFRTAGGATQTLVLDRSNWNDPIKIKMYVP